LRHGIHLTGAWHRDEILSLMGAGCWKGAAVEKNDDTPQGWTEGFSSKDQSRSTTSRPVSEAKPEPRGEQDQALLRTAHDSAWTQGELETGKELPKTSSKSSARAPGSYRKEPRVTRPAATVPAKETPARANESRGSTAWQKGQGGPTKTWSDVAMDMEEMSPQQPIEGPVDPVWPKGQGSLGSPTLSDMEVEEVDKHTDKVVKRLALPESPGKGRVARSLSVRSAKALSRLEEIESQVAALESQVADIDAALSAPREVSHEEVSHFKTQLALLEAQAHKLETSGVDGVYTGELESGKADAKAAKRSQLERLEVLFAKIEDIFHVIKQHQGKRK